ncbi:hypothetical protein Aperf_G00000107149 [Anoplocephala perfoliata]
MTEETWILQQCRRPRGYGTLHENFDNDPSQSFVEYTVQSNDTLTSIAVKNDISVGQLKHLNRILLFDDRSILPGTVLRIPLSQRSPVSASKELPKITSTTNGQRQSTSSSASDDATGQRQIMLDPLVDTITSNSRSFYLNQPSRLTDNLPERL